MSQQTFLELNDGRKMPQLGLGVWQADNQQVVLAVEAALATGYRSIDTAAIYENEEGVGVALKQAALPRQDLFITTKLWNNCHGKTAPRQALETSLKKLQLDYVDLYLIHWPLPHLNRYIETWQALIALRDEGLIRSIGVSNFTPEQIQQLIETTGVTPVVNQIELHPLFQQQTLQSWNTRHRVITESWSPLAKGGKGVFDHPVVQQLAQKYRKTPAQIVIRWHLDKGLITIPKSVMPNRIQENFAVFDFRLELSELKQISSLEQNKRLGPDPTTFALGAE